MNAGLRPPPALLELSGLAFRYPGAAAPALAGVGLRLARGRVLGLLGPNGAGKTTLIGHLAGLLALQQGEIRFDGLPLAEARARKPTRITLAPQEYAFYPMLTVAENLACFAAASRVPAARRHERIEACTAFACLEAFTTRRAGELSGGLKRRLNLAIALLPEPELLLLDEPTVGVDPQSRAFLLDAVRRLAREGCTVLYTSHYIEEIEAIADEVAILDHGRILRAAPLATLLAEGGARMTLRVGGEPAAVHALLAGFGELTHLPDGSLELAPTPGVHPASVLQALEAAGLALETLRYGQHTLERLFMQLTDRALRDH